MIGQYSQNYDIKICIKYIIIFVLSICIVFLVSCKSNSSGKNNYTIIDKEEDLKNIINDDSVIIIDVREKEEYEKGHIKNAIHIEVIAKDFNKNISELDKNKKYLLYCRSGRLSSIASEIMHKSGFKDVNNSLFGYEEIIDIIEE